MCPTHDFGKGGTCFAVKLIIHFSGSKSLVSVHLQALLNDATTSLTASCPDAVGSFSFWPYAPPCSMQSFMESTLLMLFSNQLCVCEWITCQVK